MNYHHYCSKCRLFFDCTHPDPEKQKATCPKCSGSLKLGYRPLGQVKSELALSKLEIGNGTVSYRPE